MCECAHGHVVLLCDLSIICNTLTPQIKGKIQCINARPWAVIRQSTHARDITYT